MSKRTALYGHFDRFYCKVGDKLKKGDSIGLLGNTGVSTGAHCHVTVIPGIKKEYWLSARTPSLGGTEEMTRELLTHSAPIKNNWGYRTNYLITEEWGGYSDGTHYAIDFVGNDGTSRAGQTVVVWSLDTVGEVIATPDYGNSKTGKTVLIAYDSEEEKDKPKTEFKGIDLSEFQEPSEINYDTLAKNIDFAILRAGFTGYETKARKKDGAFDTHYSELSARGVPCGAYWYSCATSKAEGEAEAKELLSIVADKDMQYPIYIDVEDGYNQAKTDKKTLTDTVIAFCETVEEHGYYVGIYANSNWFNTHLELDRLQDYDKWLASWTDTRPTTPLHGIWQYTESGKVEGYDGGLDCNKAYKDYRGIIAKVGLNKLKQAKQEAPKATEQPTQEQPQAEQIKEASPKVHIVKSGETLSKIATMYGTTWQELADINKLKQPNIIYPNQTIKLTRASDRTEFIRYTVERGDTLTSIATKFDKSISEIVKDNNISDPNVIYTGQELAIRTK